MNRTFRRGNREASMRSEYTKMQAAQMCGRQCQMPKLRSMRSATLGPTRIWEIKISAGRVRARTRKV